MADNPYLTAFLSADERDPAEVLHREVAAVQEAVRQSAESPRFEIRAEPGFLVNQGQQYNIRIGPVSGGGSVTLCRVYVREPEEFTVDALSGEPTPFHGADRFVEFFRSFIMEPAVRRQILEVARYTRSVPAT